MNTNTNLSNDLWNIYELAALCIPNIIMRVQINKSLRIQHIVKYFGYVFGKYKVEWTWSLWHNKNEYKLYQYNEINNEINEKYDKYVIKPIYELQCDDIINYCNNCNSIGVIFNYENYECHNYMGNFKNRDDDYDSALISYIYIRNNKGYLLRIDNEPLTQNEDFKIKFSPETSRYLYPTKENAHHIIQLQDLAKECWSNVSEDYFESSCESFNEFIKKHIKYDYPVIYDTKSTLEMLKLLFTNRYGKEFPYLSKYNNIIITRITEDLLLLDRKYSCYGFDEKLANLNNKILGLSINEQDYLAPTIEWLKQQLL